MASPKSPEDALSACEQKKNVKKNLTVRAESSCHQENIPVSAVKPNWTKKCENNFYFFVLECTEPLGTNPAREFKK